MFKSTATLTTSLGLIILAIALVAMFFVTDSTYKSLEREHAALQERYTLLEKANEVVGEENARLVLENETLKNASLLNVGVGLDFDMDEYLTQVERAIEMMETLEE